MIDIKLNKDNSEIIAYNEMGIPMYINQNNLSTYPNYRALCHWHEDIEFIGIVDGQMNYYINGKTILLQKGDVIMVNSGQLHYGFSTQKEECQFYCILFPPTLITVNPILNQKYLEPIVKNNRLDYLHFQQQNDFLPILESIYQTKQNRSTCYELEIISLFHKIWKNIYEIGYEQCETQTQMSDSDLEAQRKMVSFIYSNYANDISLNDIALAGKICRSKCCKIFKKYTGESPMNFVNDYRLERSKYLLSHTNLTITDICIACGFNHMSYFSKQFHLKFGCTPRMFRNTACLNIKEK